MKGLAGKIPQLIFDNYNGSEIHKSFMPDFYQYDKTRISKNGLRNKKQLYLPPTKEV